MKLELPAVRRRPAAAQMSARADQDQTSGIGVNTVSTYEIKRVDTDYFAEEWRHDVRIHSGLR